MWRSKKIIHVESLQFLDLPSWLSFCLTAKNSSSNFCLQFWYHPNQIPFKCYEKLPHDTNRLQAWEYQKMLKQIIQDVIRLRFSKIFIIKAFLRVAKCDKANCFKIHLFVEPWHCETCRICAHVDSFFCDKRAEKERQKICRTSLISCEPLNRSNLQKHLRSFQKAFRKLRLTIS